MGEEYFQILLSGVIRDVSDVRFERCHCRDTTRVDLVRSGCFWSSGQDQLLLKLGQRDVCGRKMGSAGHKVASCLTTHFVVFGHVGPVHDLFVESVLHAFRTQKLTEGHLLPLFHLFALFR